MTRREANLFTGLVLVLLGLGLALTAPRWARHLREPVTALEDDPATKTGSSSEATGDEVEARRTISVKLYFPTAERGGLLVEERNVPFSSDLSRQLRSVMEELVRGSQTGLLAAVAPDTRVLEVFITARGVAFVDISKEVLKLPSAGSESELLTVYSIVNSIVANFPAVKRVQLLVDDRPVMTLGGHVDVSRPLLPDMTFLILPSPSPSAAPEATP